MAARNIRFLKRLPQQRALTGRRGRTAINEKYGGRMGIPSLASLAQPTASNPVSLPQYPTPARKIPSGTLGPKAFDEFGGGPGIGAGEDGSGGFSGTPEAADPNSVGTMIGNQMGLSTLGRGAKGAAKTGLMAALAKAPFSAAASAIPASLALSMLSPVALASMIAGGITTGNAALNAQKAMGEEGVPPELSSQATKAIVDETFTANPLSIIKNLATKNEQNQKFIDEVTELTIANAPLAVSGDAPEGYSQGELDAIGSPVSPSDSLMGMPAVGQPGGAVGEMGLGMGVPGMSGGGEPSGAGNIGGIDSDGGSMSGASAYGGGESGDVGPGVGGGGGGGGGTVICTELHRQGLMADDIYKADLNYGKTLSDDVLRGYHAFAIPIARAMAKNRIVTAVVAPVALRWAYHIAGESNPVGALIEKIGIPACRLIAKSRRLLQLQAPLPSQE